MSVAEGHHYYYAQVVGRAMRLGADGTAVGVTTLKLTAVGTTAMPARGELRGKMKTVSLTVAQFRMLGRAIRGVALPVDRYCNPTVDALLQKGCFRAQNGLWAPTDTGRRIYASRGILRAGRSIWDSASQAERDAYRRVTFKHGRDSQDVELAGRLIERMTAQGERAP